MLGRGQRALMRFGAMEVVERFSRTVVGRKDWSNGEPKVRPAMGGPAGATRAAMGGDDGKLLSDFGVGLEWCFLGFELVAWNWFWSRFGGNCGISGYWWERGPIDFERDALAG